MPVHVRIPTVLRSRAGGHSVVPASGNTVGEALNDVVRQFPLLADQIVTEEGVLHEFVNIYRNDEDVRYLKQLETDVKDDDVISVLPAVAGG